MYGDHEINLLAGKVAVVAPSLSPNGRGIVNEADKYLHQIATKTGGGFAHHTTSRGVGCNSVHDMPMMEKPVITMYNVFAGDVELESQVIISLVYQTLRNNKDLQRRVLVSDWANPVMTSDKVTLLQELGGYIQSIIQIEYDLVNMFSENQRDYIGARNNGDLTINTTGYNVNLPMFFILLKNGLVTIDPLDSGYQQGRKILFQPYEGNLESFSSVCDNSQTVKAYCITQYWKDILNAESVSVNPAEAKIRTLSSKSLNNISGTFPLRQGYQNIYELIYSFLAPKQIV